MERRSRHAAAAFATVVAIGGLFVSSHAASDASQSPSDARAEARGLGAWATHKMFRLRLAILTLIVTFLSPSNALAASSPELNTVGVAIVRAVGTCPATIRIRVASTYFEGGYTLDITAMTSDVAYVSELRSATPQQIVFNAKLRPAYESCKGSGRSKDNAHRFTLQNGTLTYVITPRKDPNNSPRLNDVSVSPPHVNMSFAD